MKLFTRLKRMIICSVMPLVLACCNNNSSGRGVDKPSPHMSAGPALWLVKDADTSVYLFGTMHILKPQTRWQTARFNEAFSSSKAVYQEVDLSESGQGKLERLAQRLGFYTRGMTLLGALNMRDERVVLEAAAIVGMPTKNLIRMKPWLAAAALTQMQASARGYDGASGAEFVIMQKALYVGKPLRYLETAEQQLHFFADLPETSQIKYLAAIAKTIQDNPNRLENLSADWAAGNVEGIASELSQEGALGDRVVYNALLVARNRVWTRQIKQLMDREPGTFMVAVGAGHLAGDDSVIAMLRAQGKIVTRQ